MPDEMAGAGITAKERLERIENMLSKLDEKLDAKLDAMSARISTLELYGSSNAQSAAKETAVLDKRVEALEQAYAVYLSTSSQAQKVEQEFHERMEAELADAKTLMAEDVASLRRGQLDVNRLVKYATAVIIAAGIMADAVIRFYK